MVLEVGCDATALNGFLDALIVSPGIKATLFYDVQRRFFLFGEGFGEEPGTHHVDIVFG